VSAPRHDVLLVDLDGTVYRGPDAIEGAVETLEAVREQVAVSYVTNNASRGPDEVCKHLRELGLTLDADDVVTSAQAAAAVLADQLAGGDAVLVLGTEALAAEIEAVGLTPVRSDDEEPVALVQGHSPDTGWRELAEGALTLQRGATWVACNVDPTLPTPRGLLPGNGAMVGVLQNAFGVDPQVAGKPEAPLLRQAVERAGAGAPLVIGDRLDTDIAGAHAVDAESLLVLTGVSTARQVLDAPAAQRPTYVAADLRILTGDLASAHVEDGDLAGWSVRRDGDGLHLSGQGDDAMAALRALCRSAWSGGEAEEGLAVSGDGEDAASVLGALGLRDPAWG
jgi:glycerol 3-phosphatase-2